MFTNEQINMLREKYINSGHLAASEILVIFDMLQKSRCLLEEAAENIENCYGKETELSEKIRDYLEEL